MHESPQGWIVPSCSSGISSVVMGRRERDCYPQILIGGSVHGFYSNDRDVLREARIFHAGCAWYNWGNMTIGLSWQAREDQ